jgi:hypothetical protein
MMHSRSVAIVVGEGVEVASVAVEAGRFRAAEVATVAVEVSHFRAAAVAMMAVEVNRFRVVGEVIVAVGRSPAVRLQAATAEAARTQGTKVGEWGVLKEYPVVLTAGKIRNVVDPVTPGVRNNDRFIEVRNHSHSVGKVLKVSKSTAAPRNDHAILIGSGPLEETS